MSRSVGAYTIVELLVVLILASILLSAAMLLYTNVSAYQRRLQNRVETLKAFDRLEYILLNDVGSSREMTVSGRRINLAPSGIEYRFYGKSIERIDQLNRQIFNLPGTVIRYKDYWGVKIDLFEQQATVRLKVKSAYREMWLTSIK
ncbi:MAG: type II secretion system protein [Reichenbachiella sp.]|uniref:pilus assembly FimT family protein n=1 Tax=Reichenbachiella sp. TaxID=2184521 RepID=UPI003263ABF8